MKAKLRTGLVLVLLAGPIAAPVAADQLSLMNGHDWALMSAKQRQESATMVCTFYSQQGYEQNGAAFDLEKDVELRKVIAHLSNRVYLRLDAFYKNKRNRSVGISEKGLTFLELEKRSLGSLIQ